MLRSLLIQNVALIDRLELALGPGLNVFSGETGAGKSILLDAFALVLGQRADTSLIRSGEAAARVEGLFDVGENPAVRAFLEAHGLPVEEELVLVRELSREARNRCWVNGSLTTRRILHDLGAQLVDLHSQHDHQLLMRTGTHLRLVDEFGSKAHLKKLRATTKAIQEYRAALQLLAQADDEERKLRIELDHLDYQIAEIAEAGLGPGEDEDLHAELRILSGAEGLRENLAKAQGLLEGYEEGGGAAEALDRASGYVAEAAEKAGAFGELAAAMALAAEAASEVRDDLARALAKVHLDPERQREVEDRLAVIHRLTRKYGEDCVAVLATLDQLVERRESLADDAALREGDTARVAELEDELSVGLPALTKSRRRLAKKLANAIQEQIQDLAMPDATVQFSISQEEDPDGVEVNGQLVRLFADGCDRAEVMISTNPGEPLGALAKIASGGELSRVMLGMKAAMARLESVPIMVFDEIDAGVGGETGKRMAEKLVTVSATCQCLCVTHLPSIAASGIRQFHVTKGVSGGRSRVRVEEIKGKAREKEIARMLGGGASREGLRLARDLLSGSAPKPVRRPRKKR